MDKVVGWVMNNIISYMDRLVLNCWCFPEIGMTAAMRASNVMLFNPWERCCISSCCGDTIDEINVVMHAKTAVVAGHTNDVE